MQLPADSFAGRRIEDLSILRDGSTLWTLQNDESGHQTLAKSAADGDIVWQRDVGRVDHHRGEALDVFEPADRSYSETAALIRSKVSGRSAYSSLSFCSPTAAWMSASMRLRSLR